MNERGEDLGKIDFAWTIIKKSIWILIGLSVDRGQHTTPLDQKYWAAIRHVGGTFTSPADCFAVTGGEKALPRFPRTVCHRGPPRFFCSICTSNLADSGAKFVEPGSLTGGCHILIRNLRRPPPPPLKQWREEGRSLRDIFNNSSFTQRAS